MLKVRDLMTGDVVTVHPTTPIKNVAKSLVEHRISGMPVVDDGGLPRPVVLLASQTCSQHIPSSASSLRRVVRRRSVGGRSTQRRSGTILFAASWLPAT